MSERTPADAAAGLHVIDVPADHPAFDGHFPDHALLPGVVLLSEAIEALRAAGIAPHDLSGGAQVASVKFLAPVEPGVRLEVRWAAEGKQGPGARARVEVWRQAGAGDAPVLAASGTLAFGVAP